MLGILHELYIGTEDESTWVIDAKPGYGFTRTIKTVTAQEASTPIVNGGSTIAAHTYHLKWSINFAAAYHLGAIKQLLLVVKQTTLNEPFA